MEVAPRFLQDVDLAVWYIVVIGGVELPLKIASFASV